MRQERVTFAGKDVPRGVTSWTIFDANKKRKMWPAPDGVEIGEFPIEDLSPETILQRWGPGAYLVQWIGERGGRRKPLGSRLINLNAPPVPDATATTQRAPAPATDTTHTTLETAFGILDAIDRRATVQAERDRAFLQHVMEISRPPAIDANALATTIASTVRDATAPLVARLDALEGDDPDEKEEDEEEEDENADRRIFKPGQPVGETMLAEALNGLVGFAKDLAPAAQALMAAKVQSLVEEQQRAKDATPATLNGAAIQVAEVQQPAVG